MGTNGCLGGGEHGKFGDKYILKDIYMHYGGGYYRRSGMGGQCERFFFLSGWFWEGSLLAYLLLLPPACFFGRWNRARANIFQDVMILGSLPPSLLFFSATWGV